VRTLAQDEEMLLKYVGMVKQALWPLVEEEDGVTRVSAAEVSKRKGPPRTKQEKSRTRTEAGLMLATLVPDLVGSVVGRVNAQAAARRVFAVVNNARLK
jgi:sorting nexin-25